MLFIDFFAAFALILLACVFILSGISKMIARQEFATTLQQLGIVPRQMISIVGTLLPVAEVGIATTMVLGNVRVGVLAGLALLILFNTIAVFAIRFGRTDIECSCFGPFGRSTFSLGLIIRNAGLSLLAIFLFSFPSPSLGTHYPILSIYDILPVLFPALAIFPIYSLSKYFLTNHEYYRSSSIHNFTKLQNPMRSAHQGGSQWTFG